MKAVFDVWPNLKYDSKICETFRFQGRSNYLKVARDCLNDWVILRETKKGHGSGAYIAVALVTGLSPDSEIPGFHCLSFSHFLLFTAPVGMKISGRYAETSLLEVRRSAQIGSVLQGKGMRPLYAADFDAIVRAGFGDPYGSTIFSDTADSGGGGLQDRDAWEFEAADFRLRPAETILRHRQFRDQIFRNQVAAAYNYTCAVTRTRNSDGDGHFEVQGAHVWSVSERGPDIVQNGLALAGTAHSLLDNYAFTINSDFTVKVAPGLIDPAYLRLFPAPDKKIYLPQNDRLWPHAKFLEHHRAEFHKRRG